MEEKKKKKKKEEEEEEDEERVSLLLVVVIVEAREDGRRVVGRRRWDYHHGTVMRTAYVQQKHLEAYRQRMRVAGTTTSTSSWDTTMRTAYSGSTSKHNNITMDVTAANTIVATHAFRQRMRVAGTTTS